MANTTYSYRVKSYNTYGDSNYSNCAVATTGLAGTPKSPTSLTAVSVSIGKITLAWKDNSTNETSFKIYRKEGAGVWTLLKTTVINAISFSDTGATGNASATTYSYYIRACKNALCSPGSNVAIVPFIPTNLTATTSTGKIKLAWADNSNNETGFQIFKKPGDCAAAGTWSLLWTTGANIHARSDTAVSSGAVYSYKVRAIATSPAQPYATGYSMYTGCASTTAQ